jgi:hypothetical protein
MVAGLPLARLTLETRLRSPRTYGAVGYARARKTNGSLRPIKINPARLADVRIDMMAFCYIMPS